MKLKITTTKHLAGSVTAPSSKSHGVRALLLASLSKGQSKLQNMLVAEDTIVAEEVCSQLGGAVAVEQQTGPSAGFNLTVASQGVPLQTTATNIFTANSGITTRFLLPLLGLRQNFTTPVTVDCGEQMKTRPMAPLLRALRELGLTIKDSDGTCPLIISGQLHGGKVTIDGTTSQYLSALLLALPLAPGNSTIVVEKLNERPYIQMTTRWLDEQDIRYTWDQDGARDIFAIPGGQHYRPFTKDIPGDFSSASYLVAAGVLLPGEVNIRGLDATDAQGDKELIPILQKMGADITWTQNVLTIRGGKKLIGQKIDCNSIPDLVPTLAVIGTLAEVQTELMNVPQARLKETDRLRSMADGLGALGARVEEKPDGLTIYQSKLKGAEVKGCSDHRTIMALTLAGMIAQGETTIDSAEGINKTFPTFVEIMKLLGAKITKE